MNAEATVIEAETEEAHPAKQPVSQALATRKETAVQHSEPASESSAIFQIIERAARDQTVDIDKMKQLMEMHRSMQAHTAELEFDDAMSAAQEAMKPVRADANNPQTKSKYASYAALDAAIRPIYTEFGFSVTFNTADGAPEGHVRVVAKVAHRSGHRERPHIDMPADGKGAKGGDVMTKTHAIGSAVQYGRRYLLGMIFNLAVSKDDDGNAAGGKVDARPMTDAQLSDLRDLIAESGADIELFCEKWRIDALPDLPGRSFEEAYNSVKRWHEGRQRART